MFERRYAAAAVAAMLTAASCGGTRESATTTVPASPTTVAAPTATTSAPEPAASASTETPAAAEPTTEAPTTTGQAPAAMFGDIPWPCGPTETANTDTGGESGVTADSVSIAVGDDAGFVSSPGLSHEMTDAVKAFAAKCNDLGGIHGRKININYYDAAIFDVAKAMQSACDGNNFFLVGEGWAFDSGQEEIRLGCGLPAVPTYTVSAAFAHGKDVFVGVPNPSDETPGAYLKEIADLMPDKVTAAGALVSNFSANLEVRDKALIAASQFGWNFVSKDLTYNPAGEADWTPFVRQLRDANVKLVYWVGTCLPGLQQFAQTAHANGLDVPIIADANQYDASCAAANTDGALDNLYVRFAFVPLEEAADQPATQQYLDLLAASKGDTSLLGIQASSSFLLWATAASECGASLTRACVLKNLSSVHEWTGGGLHAVADPGGNHPPSCGVLLKLEGTTYVRVTPTKPASYDCDPSYLVKIAGTAALNDARLDANRISQQFTPAG